MQQRRFVPRAAVVEQLEPRRLLTVNVTVTTISATSTTINSGQTETLTATVSSSGGTVSAGTIQFYDGTTALGSPVNLSNGTAAYATTTLPVGTHVMSAVYSGSGSFTSSSSNLGRSSVIQTVAGTGTKGETGDNGPATAAELSLPLDVAVDSVGDLFIMDWGTAVIREVNAKTHIITTVAGNGTTGYSGDNGLATAAQLNHPANIEFDASDNLFIADQWNNVVREVNATTHIITTVVGNGTAGYSGDNGTATAAELKDPTDIKFDASGNMFIADQSNSVVREVNATTHVITTVAGNGTAGNSGDNGPATSAKLSGVVAIAIDSAGDLYIADIFNCTVRMVNATTHVITTIAGNGTIGYSGDNGPATSAQLFYPDGLEIDPAGNLFISDSNNNVIREVNPTTHIITTVAGNGTGGYQGDNGSASLAELSSPQGIAFDSSGDMFFADGDNEVVREVFAGNGTVSINVRPSASVPTTTVVSTSGASVLTGQSETLTATVSSSGGTVNAGTVQFYDGSTALGNPASVINGTASYSTSTLPIGVNAITAVYSGDGVSFAGSSTAVSPSSVIQTVAGNGTLGYTGDNGPATSAQLFIPQGIAIDAAGDVFIADSDNNVIREVNATTHVITTVAGNGTAGNSGDNGPATSAELHDPLAVAIDSAGDLFIADSANYEIREVNATTHVITTFAGTGTFGYSGDNGPATSAKLGSPIRLAIDSAGDLFITDAAKSVIREVNATTRLITTVAGNGNQGNSGDNGPATSANLLPDGIAVDSAGDLFIADFTDSVVREVNATTHVITTVAGNGTAGNSGDNGLATSAELNKPVGVGIDSAGDLFIADTGNDKIREVNATTHVITTVAGSGTAGYSGDNGPAISANMNGPAAVAFDSVGDLFIDESGGCVVREVFSGAATVTVTVTQPPVSSGAIIPTTLTVLQNAATTSLGLTGVAFTNGGGPNQSSETLNYAVTALPNSSFGTVYLSNGTTAVTIGNYTLDQIDGMEFKPVLNANNADASGPQSFTFTVDNGGPTTGGGVNTLTETVSIGITPVTQSPVLTAGTIATLTVLKNDVATSLGLAGVTFGPGGGSDQANDALTYAVTTIPSPLFGTVYLSDGTTAVTTGAYTLAQIDGMEFMPALGSGNTGASSPQSFTFSVNNGGSTSNGGVNTLTETVSIGMFTASGLPASQTYTKGSAPVAIAPNLVIADSAGVQITGATITIANWNSNEDRLSFYNSAALAHTFNVNSATNTAVLTLTGNASAASYQTDLRSLMYQDVNFNSPVLTARNVTIAISGNSSFSTSASTSLSVQNVNLPPVLSGIETTPLAYTANTTPVAISATLLAIDSDSTNLTSATVKISAGYQNNSGGSDVLSFVNQNGITGSFDATTGTLTLTGNVAVGYYRIALRSVTFRSSGTAVSAASRTLTITATDTTGVSSTPITRNVSVSVPPTLSGISSTQTYVKGSPWMPISSGVLLSDVAGVTISSATVSITNWNSNEDRLTFYNSAALAHTFNVNNATNTAVLTLTGNASAAAYQADLRSLMYQDVNFNSPVLAARTVTIAFTDSASNNASVTTSINVQNVNLPPVLSGIETTPLAYTANTTPVAISTTLLAIDSDSTNLTSATVKISAGYQNNSGGSDVLSFVNQNGITGSFDATTGTLTLTGNVAAGYYRNALRSVTFRSSGTAVSAASRTLTITATDTTGVASTPITRNVSVSVPPTLSGISSTQTYVKGSPWMPISSGVLLSDVAGVTISSATVSITNWNSNEDRLTFYNSAALAHTFNVNSATNTAVLTLTGNASAAAYQTDLRSLMYQDVNFNSPVLTARNVTIAFTDSASNNASVVTSLSVQNVNLPPVLSGIETTPLAYTANTTPVAISTTLLATDNDSTNLTSATVKISAGYQNNSGGSDVLSFVNQNGITGSFDATAGTLTLTGNVAAGYYRIALRSVTFRSSGTAVSAASRTLTITATDTTGASSTPTTRNVSVSP